MNRIVGIDLGTTNSLVASVDSGFPFVIPDASGRRLTPSVVHFPPDGAEPVVGAKAQRLRVVKSSETIYSVKRFIGRRSNEVSVQEKAVGYLIRTDRNQPLKIQVGDRLLLPEEISSEVLKKLKNDAGVYFAEEVSRAVITVPAYFNDAQRNATKRAGELAGLTVERIINEPTAAALAYGLDKLKEKSEIAVFDFGGGTFDLSILQLNDGIFQVLSTNGNTQLGGDDLDRRIAEFLADRIRKAGGPDAITDLGLMALIREISEDAKIKLSSADVIDVSLPFLDSKFSFNYRFTRSELESLTRDIVYRTREHCLRSLSDARLQATDLDQVILVGGQTRMPLVRQFVAELFECSDFETVSGTLRVGTEQHRPKGPALNTSQNPDEAVALGAAIQAEILAGGFKNLLLLDVTPLSLGIETFGGLMNVIIPRNSTIPTKAGEVFTTAVDNQTSMLIHVLQGERDRARDNWSLSRFTIEFERGPKTVARVGVQFEIDANGILHVLARDLKTGKQMVVDLKSAVDVNDNDVQKMVEESVEYAFEDLAARRWTESKLRALDTLAATRKGLAECQEEMPLEQRNRIDTAMRRVESALAEENSGAQTGDLHKLNAAIGELDDATKPLAEILMDRVMEATLKRRGLIK